MQKLYQLILVYSAMDTSRCPCPWCVQNTTIQQTAVCTVWQEMICWATTHVMKMVEKCVCRGTQNQKPTV